MNITKFEKAQERLSAVVGFAVAIGLFFGIDGYNLLMDDDLSPFGYVALPILLAVCSLTIVIALAVKAYGYRLAKTYR